MESKFDNTKFCKTFGKTFRASTHRQLIKSEVYSPLTGEKKCEILERKS